MRRLEFVSGWGYRYAYIDVMREAVADAAYDLEEERRRFLARCNCLGCGELVAEALAELGSLRCHDCRFRIA